MKEEPQLDNDQRKALGWLVIVVILGLSFTHPVTAVLAAMILMMAGFYLLLRLIFWCFDEQLPKKPDDQSPNQ